MRNPTQTFSLSRSIAWAVALALFVQSQSNADDADILIINAQPKAAIKVVQPVAPKEPKPANQVAKPKAAKNLSWLDRPFAYPTLYPNPLAFNMTWGSTTNRKLAALVKLAVRQKSLVVRRAAVVRRAVPNAAAQNGNQQQIRKFLEPMFKVELSFAARATNLNEAERRKLAADGKAWFEKFAVDYVKNLDPNQQQMLLQGMQGVWFNNPQQKPESPRDAIHLGVTKLVNDTLSNEKKTTFANESQKRTEFARQVSVDNLVERIDEKVKLSPDQRKKITKSLSEHWDSKRDPELEAFALNQSMWPGAPIQWVLPELTPAQQTVLNRVNVSMNRMFIAGGVFGQMFGGNGEVIDDMDDAVKAEAAEPAAPAAFGYNVIQPAAAAAGAAEPAASTESSEAE